MFPSYFDIAEYRGQGSASRTRYWFEIPVGALQPRMPCKTHLFFRQQGHERHVITGASPARQRLLEWWAGGATNQEDQGLRSTAKAWQRLRRTSVFMELRLTAFCSPFKEASVFF